MSNPLSFPARLRWAFGCKPVNTPASASPESITNLFARGFQDFLTYFRREFITALLQAFINTRLNFRLKLFQDFGPNVLLHFDAVCPTLGDQFFIVFHNI